MSFNTSKDSLLDFADVGAGSPCSELDSFEFDVDELKRHLGINELFYCVAEFSQ